MKRMDLSRIFSKEPQEAPKDLLFLRRTAPVSNEIDAAWDATDHSKGAHYLFSGRESYSWGTSFRIDTDMIIASLLSQKSDGQPLQILDVGTADGQFLHATREQFGVRVEVHGLTAHDYRKQSPYNLDEFDYKVANAEKFLDLYAPNSLDLIVSSVTMRHLVDPLGTIVQMYEALKPGGVLIVDDFHSNGTRGIGDALPALIMYLQKQGYAVVADYDYCLDETGMKPDNISTLIIRKTKDHLQLPIDYAGLTDPKENRDKDDRFGKARYSLTVQLPKLQCPLPPALESARNIIAQFSPDARTAADYEEALFRFMNSTNSNQMHVLEGTEREWKELIQAIKDTKPERAQRMQEILPLLAEGIPEWIKLYRNGEKMRQEVKRRIGLATA